MDMTTTQLDLHLFTVMDPVSVTEGDIKVNMEACTQLNQHLLSMDMVKDQLNLAIIIGLCAQL